MATDTELLQAYHQGWQNELHGITHIRHPTCLLQKAYNYGCMDALLGDDVQGIDYQTDEEILNNIKQNNYDTRI